MTSVLLNSADSYMKNPLTAGIKRDAEASSSTEELSVQRRRLSTIPTTKRSTQSRKTIRRGRKKRKTKIEVKMCILGTNAAGVLNKKESFIRTFLCSIRGIFCTRK